MSGTGAGKAMTPTLSEQLARRVRAAAGPYNNQDMPVQQAVSAMTAQIAELQAALEGMLAIVSDSKGVAGYHLNGDIAKWDEFEEVDTALALAALHKKETTHDNQ